NAGTLSTGDGYNGNWSFVITASTLGGYTAGDIVYYYIIAQDNPAPTLHLVSNPSAGLVATDVHTVSTPPSTLYNFKALLQGTYTVGSGGDYSTLTAAV